MTNRPFKRHTSYSSSRVPGAAYSWTVHSTRGSSFQAAIQKLSNLSKQHTDKKKVSTLKTGTWQLQRVSRERGYLVGRVFFAADLSVSRRSWSSAPSYRRSQLTRDSLKSRKVCRIQTIPRMLAPPCLTRSPISSHQFHIQLQHLLRSGTDLHLHKAVVFLHSCAEAWTVLRACKGYSLLYCPKIIFETVLSLHVSF